jgi:hypothetical protein
MVSDAPKWPEPVRVKASIGAPKVVACEVDVLSAERSEVGEQFTRHNIATAAHNVEGAAEIDRLPQHGRRRYQGKTAGPVLLGLSSYKARPMVFGC